MLLKVMTNGRTIHTGQPLTVRQAASFRRDLDTGDPSVSPVRSASQGKLTKTGGSLVIPSRVASRRQKQLECGTRAITENL